MNKRLIRFDWAIKNILRNKTNFLVLEGFLSELLKTNVVIKALLGSESNQESTEDKLNRVDILAELEHGEKAIIEVQCVRQWDFLSRMLYGVSKVVVEHLKKGDLYKKIPRVISVNIVYFNLGHGKDCIYKGTTQFKGIQDAAEQLNLYQLPEKERRRYEREMLETSDFASCFETYYGDGRRDGLAEGKAEGLAEGEAKGIQKGEAALLERLFKRHFTVTEKYLKHLEQADSETLSRWSENFVEAKDIESVFR